MFISEFRHVLEVLQRYKDNSKVRKMSLREYSLVIPSHNEEDYLERAVKKSVSEMKNFSSGEFEIIIVEDGCKDDTPRIAENLASEMEVVTHIHFDKRQGRGKALQSAFEQAEGEIVGYMDADLSTDVSHLEGLFRSIKDEGFDISTGSRRLRGSSVDRSFLRETASIGFNALVRFLLGSRVYDHQCGFKAFTSDAIERISQNCVYNHWFWDTEVLVRGQRQGYEVKELPVNWDEKEDSEVDLIYDTFRMGVTLLGFWWRMRRENYKISE